MKTTKVKNEGDDDTDATETETYQRTESSIMKLIMIQQER